MDEGSVKAIVTVLPSTFIKSLDSTVRDSNSKTSWIESCLCLYKCWRDFVNEYNSNVEWNKVLFKALRDCK
jgi:hypothetical protein